MPVRLPAAAIAAVDRWASRQDDKPSRSEAIRRLLERALGRPPSPATARSFAATMREHNAKLIRMFGIDPDKLTAAEIKKAAGLMATVTTNDCFPGATARKPKALAEFEAFVAAHPPTLETKFPKS